MYNELGSPGRRLVNGIDTILEGNIQMDSEDHKKSDDQSYVIQIHKIKKVAVVI